MPAPLPLLGTLTGAAGKALDSVLPLSQEDDTLEMFTKLECRAAAVLRNLAHDPRQHSLLIQSGAVDVLADIMRKKLVRRWRSYRVMWDEEGAGRKLIGA